MLISVSVYFCIFIWEYEFAMHAHLFQFIPGKVQVMCADQLRFKIQSLLAIYLGCRDAWACDKRKQWKS
jgi:hypothetical protein